MNTTPTNIVHFCNTYFGGLNITITRSEGEKTIKVLEERLNDLPLMETRYALTSLLQANTCTVAPRRNIFLMGNRDTDIPPALQTSGTTPRDAVMQLWDKLENTLFANKLLWLDDEDLRIWQDYTWKPAPTEVCERFHHHKDPSLFLKR